MNTSSARFLPERDYLALKAAMRGLVRKCGGPNAAADITRSDAARLSRFGTAHEAMHAPVDVVADLEAEAGSPDVTRVLADHSGYLLVAKPRAEHGRASPAAWTAVLGALAKETGEAITKLGEALASGGTITADEIKSMNLRGEVRDAMEVLARIDLALVRLEGEA